MITQETCYRTSDGLTFKSESEAIRHEARSNLMTLIEREVPIQDEAKAVAIFLRLDRRNERIFTIDLIRALSDLYNIGIKLKPEEL